VINIVRAKGGKQRRLPLDVITLAELRDYVARWLSCVTTWLNIPSRAMRPFPISQQWAWELVKRYGAVIGKHEVRGIHRTL